MCSSFLYSLSILQNQFKSIHKVSPSDGLVRTGQALLKETEKRGQKNISLLFAFVVHEWLFRSSIQMSGDDSFFAVAPSNPSHYA